MTEAKYGLPETVLFCRRCVISNQRPNSAAEYSNVGQDKETIHFDDERICDACRVAEAKKSIDWQARETELRDLCDRYRSKGGEYDCLVPGSGGKDSFYAAHILQHQFGMHPLTVTWAPHLYTDWGRRNFDRWTAGNDNYLCTPRAATHRLLTRLSVENLFHPFQPFIIGQKALAPKMALLHNLKLVFYGENEAEYGNPQGDTGTARRSNIFYTSQDVHLGGVAVSSLKKDYGLTNADLAPYLPADESNLLKAGVDVRYLGYYLKWHPQSCYYYAVEHGDFEASPERTPGTYSKYNSLDDKIDDFHYWTTFQKFGIGRATYDSAQEVRSGDITRDEAVRLVMRFDGEYPQRFEREINEYLSVDGFEPMTRDRWNLLAEQFRSPHLWANGKLKHAVWHDPAIPLANREEFQ